MVRKRIALGQDIALDQDLIPIGARRQTNVLLVAVALTFFFRIPNYSLVSVAIVPAFIWFLQSSKNRYLDFRISRLLLWSAIVTCGSGFLISATLSEKFGANGDFLQELSMVTWLFAVPITTIAMLACFEELGPRRVLLLSGIGGLASAMLNANSSFFWKGGGGYALICIFLAVTLNNAWAVRLIASATILISFQNDSRLLAGIVVSVLLISFIGNRRGISVGRQNGIYLILFASVALLVFFWLKIALEAGLFGQNLASRTTLQDQGGIFDVLLRGRSEWAATSSIFSQNPFGFGIATKISPPLILQALESAYRSGGDTQGTYFIIDVLGARVDLHSNLADLWFHFGIIGFGFGILLLRNIIGGVVPAISQIRPGFRLAYLFVALSGLWDLIFSPLVNVNSVCFAVALAMYLKYKNLEEPAEGLGK